MFSLVVNILPMSQRGMLTESLNINLEVLLEYSCKGAALGVTCSKKYFVLPMSGVLWLRLSTHLVLRVRIKHVRDLGETKKRG